jgi:hypothetical protein
MRSTTPKNAETHVSNPQSDCASVDSPTVSVAGVPGPPAIWLLDELETSDSRFVADHPAATLYHTLPWQQALEEAALARPMCLLATVGNEVVGSLALAETITPRGPRRLVSLPATPASGILADDVSVQWLLASRAVSLAESRGLAGVWLRGFHTPERAPAQAVSTELDWVRVPLSALEGALSPLVSADSDGLVTAAFEPDDTGRFQRAGNDLPSELLRALAASGAVALRGAYLHWQGTCHALGVWTTVNAHVHILAVSAEASKSFGFGRLLHLALRDGRARGAEWIDFPSPLTRDEKVLELLDLPGIQFAREEALDLGRLGDC